MTAFATLKLWTQGTLETSERCHSPGMLVKEVRYEVPISQMQFDAADKENDY